MKQRGMTLVELMVAVTIGLGITLAVTSLLISSENHKRTTTSTNDAEQTGSYAFYAIDKIVRGAGSAIAESAYPTDRGVLGCKLNVGTSPSVVLPRVGAFPAPFAGFLPGAQNTLVVAPLLIAKNQSQSTASDVLVVMGGSGAAGGVSRQITGPGSVSVLTMDNTVGFSASDIVLMSQAGVTDCLLEEVNSYTGSTANVTGAPYYTSTAATTNILTLSSSTSTYVTPLGNAASNNLQFLLFGVDNNRTLWSYDLLRNMNLVVPSGGDVAQAIADGVVQMNAIYGIDTNGDGVQDYWAGPGDPASGTLPAWDINTVMSSPAQMREIISVRVALVVRGEYYDKNIVTPAGLVVFTGLTNKAGTSLQLPVAVAPTDQHYRYRVFEFTVPLRNMLILAGA